MSTTSRSSRSSQSTSGSLQCSFASSNSVSRSSRSLESDKARRSRIKGGLKDAKKGDMIQIERSTFLHYVIYIGKEKIVDFVADNGGDVAARDIYETIADCNFVIDNYLDDEKTPLPADEIVQRALSCIPKDLKYDLGRYNCEHFATWCRYNFAYCHQPCEVIATLGTVGESSGSHSSS
ncbi:HRAS-like suppressor 2 [Mizuhopecten yessoensis]|uniref:HRAS-like suppressor 2 n=1 Tax=Mizuhopecten yessoensis TaxID=6573 RepID=UPI000B457DD8|nr:HRAS-like suppressor 2 [Mizuhopecten yessoensis]